MALGFVDVTVDSVSSTSTLQQPRGVGGGGGYDILPWRKVPESDARSVCVLGGGGGGLHSPTRAWKSKISCSFSLLFFFWGGGGGIF